MADVLLFHHAHGLTTGVLAFAATLRSAGHAVRTPDLFEGRVFDRLEDGVAHAQAVGFETLVARGRSFADEMPPATVYVGISLGVMPAQCLAQTRAGAAGAVLLHACVPPDAFGGPWPEAVPVQIHAMAGDPYFVDDGDIDAARAIVAACPHAEMFLYPGEAHLFTDAGLAAYDARAAEQVRVRVLEFLAMRA